MSQTQSLVGLYSGTGRFISGDLVVKGDKDFDGDPIAPEDQEYYFAVAVPKTDPDIGNILGQLHALALQHYGSHAGITAKINAGLAAKDFSWKVEDGDVASVDAATGATKPIPETKKGCYVLKFKTKYEFGACDLNPDRTVTEIDRKNIKRGDYVYVKFTAMPNGRLDHNAGIILYPNGIMRVGIGEAISGTISGTAAFADQAGTVKTMGAPVGSLPSGNVTGGMPSGNAGGMPAGNMGAAGQPQPTGMPSGSGGVAQTGMGGMPQTGGMPTAQPQTATSSPIDPMTGQPVQPHTAILSGPPTGTGSAPQPRFDPMTGQPISGNPAPAGMPSAT